MKKKILTVFLVLIGVVLFPLMQGQTEELTPQKDILGQIIELVVENNPILQSQRRLLEQIQALPNPGKGLDLQLNFRGGMSSYVDEDDRKIWTGPSYGVGIEIPLFSSSRRKERIMDRLTYTKEIEKAKQDYLRLKNSVISDLLTSLNKLSQLQNEKENLRELKSFLSSNTESLKRQIEVGVVKAADLWELRERIMNLNTKIYNLSSELEILKRETAINSGGEKSEELKAMLDEVSFIEEKDGK